MNKAKKNLFLVIACVVVGALVIGAIVKSMPWKEDSFIGKPLSELESDLASKGQSLVPVDAGSFYALTDYTLRPDEIGMRFLKGGVYRAGRIGSAVKVGYVVVANTTNKTIRAIYHRKSVDAP